MQRAVNHAMAGKRGTAVVMDIATSKVLAGYHLDAAARRVALPGSSIKTFTLLSLLETGKINDQTRLMCKRSLTVGGHHQLHPSGCEAAVRSGNRSRLFLQYLFCQTGDAAQRSRIA